MDPKLSDRINDLLDWLKPFWEQVPQLNEVSLEWSEDDILDFVVDDVPSHENYFHTLEQHLAAGRMTEEQRARFAEIRALRDEHRDALEDFCR